MSWFYYHILKTSLVMWCNSICIFFSSVWCPYQCSTRWSTLTVRTLCLNWSLSTSYYFHLIYLTSFILTNTSLKDMKYNISSFEQTSSIYSVFLHRLCFLANVGFHWQERQCLFRFRFMLACKTRKKEVKIMLYILD